MSEVSKQVATSVLLCWWDPSVWTVVTGLCVSAEDCHRFTLHTCLSDTQSNSAVGSCLLTPRLWTVHVSDDNTSPLLLLQSYICGTCSYLSCGCWKVAFIWMETSFKCLIPYLFSKLLVVSHVHNAWLRLNGGYWRCICWHYLNVACIFFVCLFLIDLDKMDSMKDEMNQADIAALHHFYSRHISDIPDDQALTELFAQVRNTIRACVVLCVVNGFMLLWLHLWGKHYTNIQLPCQKNTLLDLKRLSWNGHVPEILT